jgi:hypothetical protein
MVSTSWRKPSKSVAYSLGLLTLWPIVYFLLFISLIFTSFASLSRSPGNNPPADLFRFIFPLHLVTMLLMFALTAIYVVHAFRNEELASDKRTLWVIVLFLGNMLAFPVYWWFYVRPSRPAGPEQPYAV